LLNKISKYHWLALLAFFAIWLYVEVSKRIERDHFHKQVDDFMYKGERFTADDGRALKKRVKKLEDEAHEQPAD
jgi:hypothetical protein